MGFFAAAMVRVSGVRDDGIVPLICPTRQAISENK
jgi:hypothetical protein